MDILQDKQSQTKAPGLWPIDLNPYKADYTRDGTFTMGALADSAYEYLPKQHLLLGGRIDQYRNMYEEAIITAKDKLFFRPRVPDNQQTLMAGTYKRISATNQFLLTQGHHLTCFVGGMVGLAARIFDNEIDIETARHLTNGCIWAYEAMPSGIMPESFDIDGCPMSDECPYSLTGWYSDLKRNFPPQSLTALNMTLQEYAQQIIADERLAPGMTKIVDPRYLLRPEAIESVFVLYRITGDKALQDHAWRMFEAIEKHAKTAIAYAAVEDVSLSQSNLSDSMESFWMAETIKYFYLIFSEPDNISLDEFVLNTEAHPLRYQRL